uniref:Acetyl-coenzyme A carboxylase carboxyl transferase subunit beta, chloroplastic n=1 Tax=Trillium govanianum TaxID=82485 RepID=A0A5C1D9F5_9LILI|nr:acetyl-CoA carboxylase carboxyl transferase beta [Trillium govanianum]QEL51770.1 acetyl-CoA carboxylase carboxyl transferase beta [Trillium govanianum]
MIKRRFNFMLFSEKLEHGCGLSKSMYSSALGGTNNSSDSSIYNLICMESVSGSESGSSSTSIRTNGNDSNFDIDINHKYKHLWVQCEDCYGLNYKQFFKSKMNICEHCGYHLKMSSSDRIELSIDPGTWDSMDEDMVSLDPIEFDSEEEPSIEQEQPIEEEEEELYKEELYIVEPPIEEEEEEEQPIEEEEEEEEELYKEELYKEEQPIVEPPLEPPVEQPIEQPSIEEKCFRKKPYINSVPSKEMEEYINKPFKDEDFFTYLNQQYYSKRKRFSIIKVPKEPPVEQPGSIEPPKEPPVEQPGSIEPPKEPPVEQPGSIEPPKEPPVEGSIEPPKEPLVEEEEEELYIVYIERIDSYRRKTGLTEAVQTGVGQLNGIPIAIGVMDFEFMGGSMGSVVGEKITRLIEYATNRYLPIVIVCASGGARMQEGSLSLMQMAKISSVLHNYQSTKKLFYVSILTSPTTGGVTASFGMLGDVIIAEPNAYIAFAGKRVIELTLNKTVPEGSQSAEYLFEKGLFDSIVPRNPLKGVLSELFQLHGFFPLNQNKGN